MIHQSLIPSTGEGRTSEQLYTLHPFHHMSQQLRYLSQQVNLEHTTDKHNLLHQKKPWVFNNIKQTNKNKTKKKKVMALMLQNSICAVDHKREAITAIICLLQSPPPRTLTLLTCYIGHTGRGSKMDEEKKKKVDGKYSIQWPIQICKGLWHHRRRSK